MADRIEIIDGGLVLVENCEQCGREYRLELDLEEVRKWLTPNYRFHGEELGYDCNCEGHDSGWSVDFRPSPELLSQIRLLLDMPNELNKSKR